MTCSPAADWLAGTASKIITPAEMTWMAGYAARDRPADGVEQDLHANALTLKAADGKRFVLLTADLIGIPRSLRGSIVEFCLDQFDLPPSSLLVNASHTHCGPTVSTDSLPDRATNEGHVERIEQYLDDLEATLCEAIRESITDCSPATVEFTRARAGFAMNRRTRTDDGIRNHPTPDGPVDHEVPVLRVASPDGTTEAIAFGYACHNTTLDFYEYCGDWAGYAKAYLEANHPDAVALFLTGCAGDQNPYPRRKLGLAKEHGKTMANAVETALMANPVELSSDLAVAYDHVDIAFDDVPDRTVVERMCRSDDEYERRRGEQLLETIDREGSLPETYQYPVQVVLFGESLTAVALAGETVVEYSLRLKRELEGDVWVAGYSNDSCGYVPSARVRREGGYEGSDWVQYSSAPGPFAPSTEERIVSTVRELQERTRDSHR